MNYLIMENHRYQIIDYWLQVLCCVTKLKLWHFSNNAFCFSGNGLFKIQPLIDKFNHKFKNPIVSTENGSIDGTMVPFQDRLSFRQYMKAL